MNQRKTNMDPRDPSGSRWTCAALCIGFNELAKRADTLGSKLYFRFMCDEAEKQFLAAGGSKFVGREGSIGGLDLGVNMPNLQLYASDIEMMRKLVADHDAPRAHAPDGLVGEPPIPTAPDLPTAMAAFTAAAQVGDDAAALRHAFQVVEFVGPLSASDSKLRVLVETGRHVAALQPASHASTKDEVDKWSAFYAALNAAEV